MKLFNMNCICMEPLRKYNNPNIYKISPPKNQKFSAVQIHVHNNRRCLYVPRVPGSVKTPHNNNIFLLKTYTVGTR